VTFRIWWGLGAKLFVLTRDALFIHRTDGSVEDSLPLPLDASHLGVNTTSIFVSYYEDNVVRVWSHRGSMRFQISAGFPTSLQATEDEVFVNAYLYRHRGCRQIFVFAAQDGAHLRTIGGINVPSFVKFNVFGSGWLAAETNCAVSPSKARCATTFDLPSRRWR
jgi:hypothetical protein